MASQGDQPPEHEHKTDQAAIADPFLFELVTPFRPSSTSEQLAMMMMMQSGCFCHASSCGCGWFCISPSCASGPNCTCNA